MKKFDFKKQVKRMSNENLLKAKNIHLQRLVSNVGNNDVTAEKYFRSLFFIEEEIELRAI